MTSPARVSARRILRILERDRDGQSAPTRAYTARGSAPSPPSSGNGQLGFGWLSDAEIEALPAPEYLIDPVIPRDGIVGFYGTPGSYKTSVALDWSLALATGRDWRGCATKEGAVAYVLAEGRRGIGQRVRAWKSHHGVADATSIRFLLEAVPLIDAAQAERLIADLVAFEPVPVLVAIDTLAWSMIGGDENSARDMGLVLSVANRIRQAGSTVLLIHHTGWSKRHERGSSALRGAADTILRVTAKHDVVTLTCEKQKDDAPFDPIRLRLITAANSVVIDWSWDHDADDRLTPNCISALAALAQVKAEGHPVTWSRWREAAGLATSTFDRMRTHLVQRGYVGETADGYQLTVKGRAIPQPPTPTGLP